MSTILEFIELFLEAVGVGVRILVVALLLFAPVVLMVVFGQPWILGGYILTLPSLYALVVMWGY